MTGTLFSTPDDVLIIGSGPAGWTAAIYAARANLRTVLFTGSGRSGLPGGQLMMTTEVENFPGFDEGILGPELMERMKRQALRFGVIAVEGDVTQVELTQRPFIVVAASNEGETPYAGRSVIVATGASPLWLGLPSEARLRGRGVSSCATCDGFFFRGEAVGVVGGGDSAMEEALYLARHASTVTVIHRRNQLRASKIMQDRARAHPAIHWALNKEVVEILGDQRVEGVRLRDTQTGETSVLPLQGLFIAIGHRPNTALFQGQLELDADGYVVTYDHTQTSIPGVFAAGDVADRRYRQAITAAAAGAMAALDAEEFLTGERWTDWSDEQTMSSRETSTYTPLAIIDRAIGTAAHESLAASPRHPRVVMYTTSWCPDCHAAKRYLGRLGVAYEEINIEETPGAAALVEQWSGGYRTVPTFDINGTIVVDFNRDALDRALQAHRAVPQPEPGD